MQRVWSDRHEGEQPEDQGQCGQEVEQNPQDRDCFKAQVVKDGRSLRQSRGDGAGRLGVWTLIDPGE